MHAIDIDPLTVCPSPRKYLYIVEALVTTYMCSHAQDTLNTGEVEDIRICSLVIDELDPMHPSR